MYVYFAQDFVIAFAWLDVSQGSKGLEIVNLLIISLNAESIMKKVSLLSATAAIMLAAGCSTTTVNTNRTTDIPTPTIAATNSIADIEIGEQVSGAGCANEFLVFFKSGDSKYLQVHGNGGSSAEDRAKAAATYKALVGSKGLSTDIIVHPIWEIQRDKTFFGLISDDVCAKVVGYRGIVKSFKPADTLTQPKPESGSSITKVLNFWPFN